MLGLVMGGISKKPNHFSGKFEAELITQPLIGIANSSVYINICTIDATFLCNLDKCFEGRGAGLSIRQIKRMATNNSSNMPVDLWIINISNFIGDRRILIIVMPTVNINNIATAMNQ